MTTPKITDMIKTDGVVDTRNRKISQKTAALFGYQLSEDRKWHVAPLFDKRGILTAQKMRGPEKTFQVRGDLKGAGLFGQYKPWSPGGKRLVITEGEIDAMAYAEATGRSWPVVSVVSGAGGALRDITRNLEWISTFEEVVLFFDNDTPGREAAEVCASVLPPGKAKIAFVPDSLGKDCADLLAKGMDSTIREIVWNAAVWTPAGIVSLADIKEQVLKPVEWGYPWPWDVLTKLTYGRREGEIYALGAGTGIGKTDVFSEVITQTVTDLGRPVGLFFLETEPAELGKRLAGKVSGHRFHVPEDGWTKEDLADSLDRLDPDGDRVYIYDHFGVADWETIKSHIRFLVLDRGVKDIFLDHLTALAAGADDERVALEKIMAEMGGLVKELKFALYFISHLATPEGRPHEEGGRVFIRHFKGSRAIGFWSHFMFGLERDQQADEADRHITTFRVLKDRYTGQGTGVTFHLKYDQKTGRINYYEPPPEVSNMEFAQ